jgi:hypothetical protein
MHPSLKVNLRFLFSGNSSDLQINFSWLTVQASAADIQKIREAIKKASSLHEVERLTKILQSGTISGDIFSSDDPMN